MGWQGHEPAGCEGGRRTRRIALRHGAAAARMAVAAGVLAMAVTGCSRGSGDPRNTNWAVLGNGSQMQHHAELRQIDAASIGKLGLAWAVEMPTTYGLVGNPLIQDGVVFQGGPGGRIFANDLKTGKLLWQFQAQYPEEATRSEEHTSELQSPYVISYAVFCLKKKQK